MLLICPSTIINQWVHMFRQWSPQTRMLVLSGEAASLYSDQDTAEERIDSFIRSLQLTRNTVCVCSYDFCAGYSEKLRETFRDCVLVIDEVHLLKNEKSARSKGARRIPTRFRLGLTGTPIQNTYLELYNLVDFVSPRFLGDRKQFDREYAQQIQRGQYKHASPEDIRNGIGRALELQRKLKQVLLRRYKSDVAQELPAKKQYLVSVRLGEEQEKAYNQVLTKHMYAYDFFELYAELQKACIHPALLGPGPGAAETFRVRDCSKVVYLLEQLAQLVDINGEKLRAVLDEEVNAASLGVADGADGTEPHDPQETSLPEGPESELGENSETGGKLSVPAGNCEVTSVQLPNLPALAQSRDKVLVFCHNLALLNLLELVFQKLGVPALRMDGGTPVVRRAQLVREFQTGGVQIFLLTPRVGGVGLNLTAANKVYLLQPSWNPAVDQQAIERSWRIGQTREV